MFVAHYIKDVIKRYIIYNLSKDKYYFYGEMKDDIWNAQDFNSLQEAENSMGCNFWSDNNGDYIEVRTIYTNEL